MCFNLMFSRSFVYLDPGQTGDPDWYVPVRAIGISLDTRSMLRLIARGVNMACG